MAVALRLARHGCKKRPFYRIVAADSSKPRDGRFIEIIGHYNPLPEKVEVLINKERAAYWMDQGAKLSNTVKNLFAKEGLCK